MITWYAQLTNVMTGLFPIPGGISLVATNFCNLLRVSLYFDRSLVASPFSLEAGKKYKQLATCDQRLSWGGLIPNISLIIGLF